MLYIEIEDYFFLSAISRAQASRDLNQLFCFVKLGCLSAFWFICQNLVCLPEFWFVFHLFKNLENIFSIQISLKIRKLIKHLTFDSTNRFENTNIALGGQNPFRASLLQSWYKNQFSNEIHIICFFFLFQREDLVTQS